MRIQYTLGIKNNPSYDIYYAQGRSKIWNVFVAGSLENLFKKIYYYCLNGPFYAFMKYKISELVIIKHIYFYTTCVDNDIIYNIPEKEELDGRNY